METLIDLKAYWSLLGAELAKQANTIEAEALASALKAQAVYLEWAKASAGKAVVKSELDTQGRLYNAVLVQLHLVNAVRLPPAFDLTEPPPPTPRPAPSSSSSGGWGLPACLAIGAAVFFLGRGRR